MVGKEKTHRDHLEPEHHPEEIHNRITEQDHDYLGDAILGAIDGGVTTFAVITGAVGGGFGSQVVVVLGIAKLVADAFSMATSNYLRSRSEQERIEDARKQEQHHIRHIPEGEREEIRQIFAHKGFKGEILEKIVETISEDEEQWVEIMLSEELGLPSEAPNPFLAAASTFGAFLLIGLIPLIPFLVSGVDLMQAFWISGVITAAAFLSVGVFKGIILNRPVLTSGLQTLLTGSGAAVLSYLFSHWLRNRYGVG